MNKELFKNRYKRLLEEDEAIQMAMNTVLAFEQYTKKDIGETVIDDIKLYMDNLILNKANKYNNVIHIARYYYYIDMKDQYIHMTKYFNTLGVLEHIINRIQLYESTEVMNNVIDDIQLPPFGTDSTDLPRYTKSFLDTLQKHIPKNTCNQILAGNNHQIPSSSFDQEKKLYQDASTFKEYLENRHKRKVEELEHHYKTNQIWFEQIITPEVIEFVKEHPEVLSGVIKDDKLYVTKIPYDIHNFLESDTDILKRYYACHCSFVRENILTKTEDIPQEWCYCSGGFAKHPFETILDQELDIKLISTPLNGDHLCRFEIDLSTIEYKK